MHLLRLYAPQECCDGLVLLRTIEPVISTVLKRCVVVTRSSAHLFARGTHVA
jgi:hypothetical protein